jgi:glycosyltransferase involved in cell wall biosynthesis
MNTDEITPLIIAFNEAPNLERCLNGVRWARRIVVIDSGSTDATLDICRRFPQVEVVHNPFRSFAEQCNFGLGHIRSKWALSFDADYIAEPSFHDELQALPESETTGYYASFIYCIYGRKLRGGLYPPRLVLYQREHAEYHNDGHGHRVTVPGAKAQLASRLLHDDRKPLDRWLASQLRYAAQESKKLQAADPASLALPDRLRRTGWANALAVLPYCLLWKGGLFDGPAGWLYALQRTLAEVLLAIHVLDRKLATHT